MKFRSLLIFCMSLLVSFTSVAVASAEQGDTILTANRVELRETISPQGFVHPGISCNAQTLAVMREKVIAGVSPWVDYFEGMRRTRYAGLNQKPSHVDQIINDGGIGGFAHDAQLLWVQTILYVITGNEEYRKIPVDIIKWYGSRTEKSFFPRAFPDSHIKIGKYVYTLCSAVDILRAIPPKSAQLAVTPEMVDALQKYCLYPIRKNCIERNGYFMNQHSYAIMGYLASTILGDEAEDYKQAVEWTTVNATSANQGRNGSIKQQIRLVTRNDKTGETVKPTLELVEMGRDMAHAEGNINNLLMMSKTIDFQKTKVDPVNGTVTDKANGVSPLHFLDDRLPKGAALYAKYNLGYGLPWVPTYSENDPNHPDFRASYDQISYFGRGAFGSAFHYYYLKGLGFDLESGPLRFIKVAFDAAASSGQERIRSGGYLDTLHNYGFDFWIGLSAAASDAAPDAAKAKRALASVMPPPAAASNGAPAHGRQLAYQFVDLSAHARPGDIYPGSPRDISLKVMRDADGTGYVRMTIAQDPRTMVITSRFPPGSGLRLRSNSFVKLSFYRDEDFALRGLIQELYVPNTGGKWRDVLTTFDGDGITYIRATPLAGPATIDFDRVETDKSAVRPLAFASAGDTVSLPAFVGAHVGQVFTATGGTETPTYSALNLPAGAKFVPTTGALSWIPATGQEGDHTLYVTARTGDTMRTLRVDIHVARDLHAAQDYVARAYDPAQQYVSATEQAFKAALKSRDLAALKRATDGLELLNPRLPDGTLDYRNASTDAERGIDQMADNDPMTWGGLSGFDKNITMDFGNRFKVKSKAFLLQCRNGFPVRVLDAVVYGSNDRKHWTLLTENRAKSSPELQTLTVKQEERTKAYRYLRFFMPARAYGIFEIGKLRIVGERIEDYSPDYHVAYIGGYKDGTFRPEQPMTRAEAARALAALVDDYTDKGAYDCAYVDVARDADYYDDVAYLSRKGVIHIVGGNRFRPDDPMTRGEFADFVTSMNHLSGKTQANFPDVTDETPYAVAIRLVVDKGWLKGQPDGTFRPNAPMTRAEVVAALNKMLQRQCGAPLDRAQQFHDVEKSFWAYREILEASTTHAVQSKNQW